MANKSIYPYGTGGSLPSSIGLVNDLTTGGADKALTAEQGKVIGSYITSGEEVLDVAGATEHNYSLGSAGWYGGGKHKVFPVSSGDVIKIKVESPGGFRGFFTNAYYDGIANPPYVSGTDRVWQNAGTMTVTAPNDAAYLCLCTVDGTGSKTWQASILGEKPLCILREEIVNNLSEGGYDVPLSAEQGKVLNEKITGDSIPSGLAKHAYSGPIVKVSTDQHYVAVRQVSTITSVACQGGACFGDYLFLFTENNTTCWVYNLATSTLLQTITIPSSERGFVSNCHCNTVNFGSEYYDTNDPFPLIYVSTGYASDGYSGALVYRINATTENNVTTYSLSLVQTFKMPGTGWTEFLTGEDGFCFLCYTNTRTFYKMRMPVLADGDVTFDLEQALSVYQFTPQPSWYNGSYNQGRFYKDGKIYLVSGNTQQTRLFIVLNLAEEMREVEIDLNATFGLSGEPETCFVWQDHICIAYRGDTKVYAMYFE